MAAQTVEIEVDGRTLRLSNLEKVLFPDEGFTKGAVINYYRGVAPALLAHLKGRPLTLKRYPNGVADSFFYEKQCPKHRPDWMNLAPVQTGSRLIEYCLVEELAALVWVANTASIEIHPLLACFPDVGQPTKITFDLDPGEPAGIKECCQVAVLLKDVLDELGLQAFPKTSGSKGMQLEVPLNTSASYEETKPFALALARLLEARHPALVVSKMDKSLRPGKVLIDWSQNDDTKTTVSVYSLRAKSRPYVSTPVTWDEVQQGAEGYTMSFIAAEVLERIEMLGDLQAPVLSLRQSLPALE